MHKKSNSKKIRRELYVIGTASSARNTYKITHIFTMFGVSFHWSAFALFIHNGISDQTDASSQSNESVKKLCTIRQIHTVTILCLVGAFVCATFFLFSTSSRSFYCSVDFFHYFHLFIHSHSPCVRYIYIRSFADARHDWICSGIPSMGD